MKIIFWLLTLLVLPFPAFALDVFSLNVFDQLQGKWEPSFREQRLKLVSDYIRERSPGIVVFQEAQGGGTDSVDGAGISDLYPHRKYVHEMTGADGASYGYWIGAKEKPRQWIEDSFSFKGGVDRKVIGAVWDNALGEKCLGVIGLHLSYQNSKVRQLEAAWLLNWVKQHEVQCPRWLVVGDFNADRNDQEMEILFSGGLNHLYRELKPTVGAFNPIRRIYGENIPSLTIDWALGWNLGGEASVVLDSPVGRRRAERDTDVNGWVSDHAGVWIKLSE